VISDTATLRPDNLINNENKIHKTIHLIDQKSINEIIFEHQLTDIPMDLMKETYIDRERLQTLGKILEHSRTNIYPPKNK